MGIEGSGGAFSRPPLMVEDRASAAAVFGLPPKPPVAETSLNAGPWIDVCPYQKNVYVNWPPRLGRPSLRRPGSRTGGEPCWGVCTIAPQGRFCAESPWTSLQKLLSSRVDGEGCLGSQRKSNYFCAGVSSVIICGCPDGRSFGRQVRSVRVASSLFRPRRFALAASGGVFFIPPSPLRRNDSTRHDPARLATG